MVYLYSIEVVFPEMTNQNGLPIKAIIVGYELVPPLLPGIPLYVPCARTAFIWLSPR